MTNWITKVTQASLLGAALVSTSIASEASSDLGAIWCIGDSITQGNADRDGESTPRSALYDLLKSKGYDFTFTGHHTANPEGLPDSEDYLYHSGISGIRIGHPEYDARAFAPNLNNFYQRGTLKKNPPSLVLIMLGTNDIGAGFHNATAPDRLKALINDIYQLDGIGKPTVLVSSIPPNRRKEQERTNVMIFNGTISDIASDLRGEGKDVYFVDQFQALDQTYESSMTPDNLHPSGAGNKVIAETWVAAIEDLRNEVRPVATPDKFPGERGEFKGYETYKIRANGGHFEVICPKVAAPGKPWLWRSLFWHAINRVNEADLKLVDEGYHIVIAHGDVAGHPSGNKNINAAYDYVTKEHGFNKKVSMSSMSRGTLSLFRWAFENPEKVSSIYVDNGVTNIKSWPAGQLVEGNVSIAKGAKVSWEDFKRKFGYKTDAEAIQTKESPIEMLEPLAKHNVPILLVCGDNDPAVPYSENDAVVKERYEKLGGTVEMIVHSKGHSHGLPDPTPILDFIRKHFDTAK